MAFPTIPTSGAGRVLSTAQANTTATRTFPSLTGLTKNSGDLLIAIAVAYQTSTGTNAAFSSWGGSFTETADRATSTTMAIGVAHKWSTGSETGTFTVTQAGTITGHCQLILLSIAGAHASTAPEVSTKVDGTGSNATPSSLDPAGWASEDTLWIEVIGSGEINTTGSMTGVSGVSTNFGSTYTAVLTQDIAGGVEAAVAFRQVNASSQQPDTAFSVDTTNARHSVITIAVRPAPAAQQGSGSGTITWAGSATGTNVHSGSASGSISWAGSSTGVRVPQGTSTGTVTWVGTATGEAPVVVNDGSATGTITWAGTATGTNIHSGSSTGAVTWAGSSTGTNIHSGSSTGTVTWTGTAQGVSVHRGASTGSITWAGTATGESPAPGVQEGEGNGSITWTGTANGTSTHTGAGSGTIGWAGTATGIISTTGTGPGTVTWAGVATGQQPSQYFYAVGYGSQIEGDTTSGTGIEADISVGTGIITVEGG